MYLPAEPVTREGATDSNVAVPLIRAPLETVAILSAAVGNVDVEADDIVIGVPSTLVAAEEGKFTADHRPASGSSLVESVVVGIPGKLPVGLVQFSNI